eukprot:TRINITY_DN2470_c0_g1::TRINITY_DN2470_c0_g1_i1::g.8996::m.8996 TRINITY_DN2470_c0_g1::TRINITY_DN2470_c0_g1_i1::g.8996  ORF type:complete len:309 (-),score=-2.96,SAM_1/PF00536.25/0.0022,SAM_1/PF00536.25/0.21,SAM_1/PF00536.25/0.066,SAM_2/PF07647.12/0.00081,SAM_2/PF07647.12/0.59,SAM_2/PF07647.12/0.15,Glucosamine_iso/PF01182.15/16,Glucosamine_iso/PF01182.15/14,Glucosamine_iso/PF01182.15/10,TT_ORF1/PF02956.9/22,TT_ORF1/PF02956.9/6,TT_ORF1/PF02956.9/7.9,CSTF_C/PF14304.1/12,CSTF_C/PF14304.1/12,CSTF_C/PF1
MSVKEWKSEEVCRWMEENGYQDYVENAKQRHLAGYSLVSFLRRPDLLMQVLGMEAHVCSSFVAAVNNVIGSEDTFHGFFLNPVMEWKSEEICSWMEANGYQDYVEKAKHRPLAGYSLVSFLRRPDLLMQVLGMEAHVCSCFIAAIHKVIGSEDTFHGFFLNPVMEWKSEEVCSWMEANGYQDYVEKAKHRPLAGSSLVSFLQRPDLLMQVLGMEAHVCSSFVAAVNKVIEDSISSQKRLQREFHATVEGISGSQPTPKFLEEREHDEKEPLILTIGGDTISSRSQPHGKISFRSGWRRCGRESTCPLE